MLRSADKPNSLTGPSVAWASLDEAARCDESIWGVIVSRARLGQSKLIQRWITGTPEGLNWVYDKWVDKPPNDTYQLLQATTRENTYLDGDYVTDLMGSHDSEEIKRIVGGQFLEGGVGRIYKQFNRAIHTDESSPFCEYGTRRLIPELPICVTCDFNVNPCIWLIVQHVRGVIYVADEIVLHDTSTGEMISELQSRLPLNSNRIIIYGDPAGRSRTTTTGDSDYALIKAAGFRTHNIAASHPPVKDRILAVNAKIRNAHGNIGLLINPNCEALIKDMERVKWKDGATGVIDKSDNKLTHASDALGYFIHRKYSLTQQVRPPQTKLYDAVARGR